MFTLMPPSALEQRIKRSPNTRNSSELILKPKALTYHWVVFSGAGDFRSMWVIRYGMRAPPRWWVDKIRLPAQYNRPEDSHCPGLRLRSPHRPPSQRQQQE